MRSSVAVVAAFLAFLVLAPTAQAGAPEVISTRCREIEVPLDDSHSVSRLAGCGDEADADLLWHLDRIDKVDGRLDGTYHRQFDGAGVVVYVMDTGVLAAHAEFLQNGGTRVIAGYDETASVRTGASTCTSPNKALAPCFANYSELAGASHGTSVASLVAGREVGVAPEAMIVSIRVMNESALATTRTYLNGLDDVIRHAWDPKSPQFRTAVVNISGWMLEQLATDPDPNAVSFSAVERKIRDMIGGVDRNGRPDPNGKRFLFVVAANNLDNGCGAEGLVDRFPATLGKEINGLITVGGMTAENNWWGGSCRGGVEVLAPSQGIFSATITAVDHYRGTKPYMRSGTSFGAPIVSGIAARMLSENPNLTPAELESLIENTPSRINVPEAEYAAGRVAVFRPDGPATMTATRTAAIAKSPASAGVTSSMASSQR